MKKALLKKQLLESFSWLYFNKKNGKKRNSMGSVLYMLLYTVLFGVLGCMFYVLSLSLCEPLCALGLGWLYFALVSLLGIVLGVFGSVFNTYASLYQAKDNDLLLSMPIPASNILLMRLFGVYMMGLIYELIVMIPALIVWFMYGSVGLSGMIFSILIPFILSFFVMTLSCVLGWVVALVSSKIRNKSFITVVLSLAFIVGYYYVYARAYEMLTNIIVNAKSIAGNVKSALFPFYHMGRAAEGSGLSMLIFTGMILALFAIVYAVLSHSFVKLATANRGAAKVKYKKQKIKAGNADSALLKKEFKRFTGSANYMMNCGLSIIFMLAAAVALLLNREVCVETFTILGGEDGKIVPLLITAALCTIVSMNDITAPSISLEGKNIWLLQVLPISPWQVLKAKLKLHLILTFVPAMILTVCALIVLRPSIEFAVLISFTVAAYILTMALFGLVLNLKAPNLNWTNEVVPIKQSLSVTVALFGGWILVFAFGGIYFAISSIVSPFVYLSIVSIILIVGSAFMIVWLKNKGTKIFAAL
ncbi:MAG: hypothetical protein J6A75_06110 [Lachnospiraceae bacterium]|nr:hypothetical protein [Lachnospiraceae bacterium]